MKTVDVGWLIIYYPDSGSNAKKISDYISIFEFLKSIFKTVVIGVGAIHVNHFRSGANSGQLPLHHKRKTLLPPAFFRLPDT